MSRIHTLLIIDMTKDDLPIIYEEGFDYSGPVALCKGQDFAKQQTLRNNALEDAAIARANAQQDKANSAVAPYLQGSGVGFDPQQLALMRSMFLNQNAMNYNDAGANIRTALLRRGSATTDMPSGGDYTRGLTALEGSMASDRSSGLANIDLQNLQTALNNRWNAINTTLGLGAQMQQPIGAFSSAGASALSDYIKAANTGFGSSFANAFGSALGGGLGKMGSGFITGGLSHIPGVG